MKPFQLCLERFKIPSDGLYCYWRTHWLEFNQITTNSIQAEICKSSPGKGKTSGHPFTFFLKIHSFIFYMYQCFACMCVCVPCTCLIPSEANKDIRTPATVVGVAMGLLELVLRTSAKAESALNHWALDSEPQPSMIKPISFKFW